MKINMISDVSTFKYHIVKV